MRFQRSKQRRVFVEDTGQQRDIVPFFRQCQKANRETRGELSVNRPEPLHLNRIGGFYILHERTECSQDDRECTQRHEADQKNKRVYGIFANEGSSMAGGTVCIKVCQFKLGESRKGGSRTYEELGLISVSTLLPAQRERRFTTEA